MSALRRLSTVAVAASSLAACGSPRPPGDGGQRCAAAEVLDGGSCVPAACGTGTWGSVEVDTATVYVNGAAGSDGEGTADAPFLAIQQGADAAAANGGGTVAIAAGTYLESVGLTDDHKGVRLLGRCADFVTVDGSAGDGLPAFEAVATRSRLDVTLSGITLTGGDVGIWSEGATLSVGRRGEPDRLPHR